MTLTFRISIKTMQVRLWGRCIPTAEAALLHPLASALSPSALLLSPSACSASSFSSSHTDILFLSNNTTVSIVFRINLLNICCNNFSFWHCLCLMCQVKDISFQVAIYQFLYLSTRSLEALRAPTSRLQPFGLALGPSGLLDFVLHALRALRPCDPRINAMMG